MSKFREYFIDFSDRYVLIGGIACTLVFDDRGLDFRATVDMDTVLMPKNLDKEFCDQFLRFIRDGGYSHIRKNGEEQFYRFDDPADASFPRQVELFCARPEFMKGIEKDIGPVPIDDTSQSLSAIYLDEDYMSLIPGGITTVEGLSVLRIELLIVFKIRAWLNLTEERKNGGHVDSRDVKKHRADIVRLVAELDPDQRTYLPDSIRDDIREYCERALLEPYNDSELQRNFGLLEVTYDDIITLIRTTYMIDATEAN